MASAHYSGAAALFIVFVFALLDLLVNFFGLAWNGRFFTLDNIRHWFNLADYKFTLNPIDFLVIGEENYEKVVFKAVAVIRIAVLAGGALSCWAAPMDAPPKATAVANVVFAVMLLLVSFAPAKLLAFYEDDQIKLAVGDWILMIWCIAASLFAQLLWVQVVCRVKENLDDEGRAQLLGEDEEEETNEEGLSSAAVRSAEQKETWRLLVRLFSYMAKEWPFYGTAFTFLFLFSLSRVFIPYYTGEVVSSVVGSSGSYERLHRTVIIMTLLSLGNTVFGGLRGSTFMYSQARIDRRIRHDLFRSIVQQEIGFFDANKTGEICSRLTADCQTMSNTLSLYMNVLTRNTTMLFGSLIFMFTLSWRLSMITFIAIPIIFLISKVYGVYYERLAEETQNSVAEANDIAEEVLSAIRTVKSFACEIFERDRFTEFLDKTLGIAKRKSIAHVGFIWTSEFLQMGILTVVLWYGGHLVIKAAIEPGLLVSFLLYQFQLGENLRELGEVWNGLMQAVGASRKVFEFIDRAPKVDNNGNRKLDPDQIKGKIEFKDVHFSYPIRPDLPIMRGVSFTAEPGQVVALVGPSGSGKSSCIAMLEHFYEPTQGEVLLDGIPIREFDHAFLHLRMSLVGQEPILYARSVAENVRYGMHECPPAEASDEKVEDACRMANAHAFIMNTVEGYGTNVGEKGSQMSGGQKQRIAIARALVRNPVVLLLDEATSALDSESEALVQEAISKNLKGRTVILIAHRLSTVENADKIVVINQGQVEQMGTHKELMQIEGGLYKQLVHRQLVAAETDAKLPAQAPALGAAGFSVSGSQAPAGSSPGSSIRGVPAAGGGAHASTSRRIRALSPTQQAMAHSLLGSSFQSSTSFL